MGDHRSDRGGTAGGIGETLKRRRYRLIQRLAFDLHESIDVFNDRIYGQATTLEHRSAVNALGVDFDERAILPILRFHSPYFSCSAPTSGPLLQRRSAIGMIANDKSASAPSTSDEA